MDIVMPRLGESMTEGVLTSWYKKVGDTVTEGEPIGEIGTDKIDTELASPGTGTITELLLEPDDVAGVGAVIARLDP
jgi:pyruvate dehydrogenase E2 component (dihydrolipoamide acetyltransferase)